MGFLELVGTSEVRFSMRHPRLPKPLAEARGKRAEAEVGNQWSGLSFWIRSCSARALLPPAFRYSSANA